MINIKKKVITITFQRANNYGAQLQAFALQKVLGKKYKTMILDYDNKNISDVYKLFNLKKLKPLMYIYCFLIDILKLNKEKKRISNFNKFRNKMRYTKYFANKNTVLNNLDDVNCYVVGSDQMWNPRLTGGYDDIYFLNNNTNAKKITYAVSSAINEQSPIDEEFLKRIKNFNEISVREQSLKKYIEKYTDTKVKVVVDPVLLLTKDNWIKYLKLENKIMKGKYIFVYSVANSNDLFYETVNKLAKDTNCKIVYFDSFDIKHKFKCKKVNGYKYGPSEFLNLLYHSEYVITTSFHAMALSALFNKKMFIIPTSNPERLYTTMSLLSLQKYIVKDASDIDKVIKLDDKWEVTNKLIKKYADESINWLYASIEK